MKKTIMGVVTIVTVLCMCLLATSVNAASLSVDNNKVSKGDVVTVTVNIEEQAESMQFDLAYDQSSFKFIEDSISVNLGLVNKNAVDGVLIVSAFDTSKTANTISLQFEALENVDNAEFTISGTEFTANGSKLDETFANPTVTVTVADPEQPTEPENPTNPDDPTDVEEPSNPEEPTNPGDTTDTEEPSNTEKPAADENNNDGTYVDEEGNTITKLPQTGSIAPTIILAVVAVGIVALISYKAIKNRR